MPVLRRGTTSELTVAAGLLLSTHVSLFLTVVEGENLQQEEEGPAGDLQLQDDDFLITSDVDDRFEILEPETVHEGRTCLFGFKIKCSSCNCIC